MRKLWASMIIGMAMSIDGKELTSFSEISTALAKGNCIRMVIQIDRCDIDHCPPSFIHTEAHAVMLRPTYLQFANTSLTTNYPGFEKIPVLENVTYRILDDGEVCITVRLITLPNYQVNGENSVNYFLGHSARVYVDD